ncbi:hypothetical protein L0337_34460 [candidate division KSB1 bacterium]|nr:hypothetical protein [candidate division KSB1 bacterium]
MAPFESETSIAIGTRRLNPSSINFCYPFILSLENFTLHRQVKAVPIPALPSCIFKYTNDLVTPPILNHGNPIWAISIIPIDEFNPINVIIRPISSDRIDYFLQPISCQKFFTDLLEFIQPFVALHPVEIVGTRINKFDSNEIAIDVKLDELLHIHLNEHALVKIESALQAVRISRFEVSVLTSGVFEDNGFYAITASIKTEFTYHSISTKIQYWEDFIQLPRTSVHAHSHNDPLLQRPINERNASSPITHGGQPRKTRHIRKNARKESSAAFSRSTRRKSEILCERHGILWQILDENECELQNLDWQNEFAWFKLSGISLNHGRLVKYATNGFYLLIVPCDWICLNIESPCFEFQQVEQLATDYWSGYIIRADHDETNFPRFRTPDAGEKCCEWQRTRFVLEGNCIKDAPSRLGPLYVLNPPKIKANLPTDWHEIGVIVLGEEGIGRNKAKWQLFPQGTKQIQDLISKRIEQRSGWYFLRFYDREDNLIESCDFRFVTDLIAIDFPRHLITPATHGHKSQDIVLRHNKPLSITSEQHELFVQRISETETRLLIPPESRYDSSEWCLDKKAPIKLELNRLWWCVADENTREADIEWQDKPLEFEESRFTATSSEALWLKIPKAAIVAVEYGFRHDNPRKLPYTHSGEKFVIPLREFCDAADLQENEATFQLWITELSTNGTRREHHATIFRIKRKIFHCRVPHCSFVIEERSRAESHFREIHSEYGYRTLTYTEAQKQGLYGKGFPSKIYQCPYNPEHYIDATITFQSANSLMDSHIERECKDARRMIRFGPIKVGFEVVDDTERIRRQHLPTLPIWVKCQFCDSFFKKSADDLCDDIYTHLLKTHRKEIFCLK